MMKPTLASLWAVYLSSDKVLICEHEDWKSLRERSPGLVLLKDHVASERQAERIAGALSERPAGQARRSA
jgi:hypothetical protein